MEIDSSLLKLYMAIGFLATRNEQLNEAKTIFNGIAMMRPQSAYPQIGLGCVAMGNGDLKGAIDILRNAPVRETEEKELCNAFLCMALKLSGYNDESNEILNNLISHGKSKTAVEMARKMKDNM